MKKLDKETNKEIESIDPFSMDLEKMNKEKLKSVFPECFVEDKLDIDKLLALCGEYIIEDFEKYKFEWKGKSECLQLAQKRSMGALRPCPEESVNFENTKNIYIEGDNLEVLKLLQVAYFHKVKMIYIDPPYNTGHDFVYEDDYSDPMERYKAVTSQSTKSNPETMGRFHTKWLNMMYPRLKLASYLLRDDGVIFISIDDVELFNLKKVCDEVFGEENFVNCFPRVTKKAGKTTDDIAKNHDFILMYTKNNITKYNLQSHTDEGFKNKDEYFEERGYYKLNQTLDYDSLQYSPSLDYPIEIEGKVFYAGNSYQKYLERQNGNYARADWAWRWSKELFEFGYKNGFIVIKNYDNYSRIYTKTYQNVKIIKKSNGFEIENIKRTKALSSLEFIENEYSNDNAKKKLTQLFNTTMFDYSKPTSLIKFLCKFTTNDNDIILDFFSGSATTAHAVMQLNAEDGGNRQFIMVQLPELCDEKSEAYKAGYNNICEIGKERIRRAGKKILDENNQLKLDERENPLDVGFKVFKLDTSNLNEWNSITKRMNENSDTEILQKKLDLMLNKIKPDRSDLDVVYEVVLKLGFPLSTWIGTKEISGKKCFIVGEECLIIICLEQGLTFTDIQKMAEYKPVNLIFSKHSFADSNTLINAHYKIRDIGIEIKLI